MGSDFRARRGLRALVVTTVISLALGGLFAGVASATPPTNLLRAQRGAQWLADQIKHNGGFVESFGVADPTDTAYAVMGMRAVGVDKPASNLAISYLEKNIGTQLQLDGHDSAGGLADYILASVSDAVDSRHFGGTAAKNNLVNRLLATQRTTGTDVGLFGVQDPTYDGAFRQGLALAALKAAGVSSSDPHVKAGINWLTKQECADGLWEAYRSNTNVVCAAANPNTFTGPDTNSSGMAIQGLAAWKVFPLLGKTLVTLKAIQSSNGGFPFVAAKNQASDPDSTALVIQALVDENSAPASAYWKQGANTPFTALASWQIGCSSAGFGAFFFPGSTSPNVLATAQAVPAMDGKTIPVALSTASKVLSLTRC